MYKRQTLDSVHKVYLSAILDLCDRRPVAYVIGDSNNNALVFETFDKAVKAKMCIRDSYYVCQFDIL